MTRILFVCLGNICRSPTAEAVLRAKANAAGLAVRIDSAGTANWHTGKQPYGPMQDAARPRGYRMDDLGARQVRQSDFDEFDHIIAMDAQNLADLRDMAPAAHHARLSLLTDYAPELGASEVPDPYYTRDFDGALDLIETASDGLLATLRRG